MPRFEPIDRRQVVLEPLDIEQLIPPDHAARNVWELLGRMDLSRFSGEIKSVHGHAGRNAWEPRLLIAMWIYAYSRGISSAREIERQCAYEPAFRWLTGLKTVNHHTLSDFRVEHGAALQDLFAQVLGLLAMEKLITLERVTVDGTKIRACVNKKAAAEQRRAGGAHIRGRSRGLPVLPEARVLHAAKRHGETRADGEREGGTGGASALPRQNGNRRGEGNL